MNRSTVLVAIVLALVAGAFIGRQWPGGGVQPGGSDGGSSGAREILYWVAPMDRNYRRDQPGKSPMGMDLVPVYADEASGGGDAVTISPAVEQNLGVRTAVAEIGPLWRLVRATGYVGYDESKISHIHLRIEGWVEELKVDQEGESVSAGDVVARVYSPDLVNAQKEFLQARERGNRTITEAAREKLRALGMVAGEIDRLARRGSPSHVFDVIAPQDGIVTELNVREGMHLMPATIVVSIADLSSVWVHAEVFESQAEWVSVGQHAEITLDYLPGRTFKGEVEFIDPVLDPKTRTLNVRLRFDNSERLLKPNMFAAVRIFGGPKRHVLSIPSDALIAGDGVDRVVVALGEGRYRVHEVEAGIRSGDWVEIRSGLESGDRVVTSAQFLIDSEASLSGSVRRLGDVDIEMGATPVTGVGRVVGVSEPGMLTIDHDPIEALDWPAMTMDFRLENPGEAPVAAPGAIVHFTLVRDGSGAYAIRDLHVMGQEDHEGADR